jgi:hypothetical protein
MVLFSPSVPGSFTSSLTVHSSDPNEQSVTVNLRGGSGADLTGEWLSLEKKCRNTSKGVLCTITGLVNLSNIGIQDAAPT